MCGLPIVLNGLMVSLSLYALYVCILDTKGRIPMYVGVIFIIFIHYFWFALLNSLNKL